DVDTERRRSRRSDGARDDPGDRREGGAQVELRVAGGRVEAEQIDRDPDPDADEQCQERARAHETEVVERPRPHVLGGPLARRRLHQLTSPATVSRDHCGSRISPSARQRRPERSWSAASAARGTASSAGVTTSKRTTATGLTYGLSEVKYSPRPPTVTSPAANNTVPCDPSSSQRPIVAAISATTAAIVANVVPPGVIRAGLRNRCLATRSTFSKSGFGSARPSSGISESNAQPAGACFEPRAAMPGRRGTIWPASR